MTAGMKIDETPAANGAYFCDFLWARLPAATPEQAAEDGCAPSAEPDSARQGRISAQ